jgi:hypothetical protein
MPYADPAKRRKARRESAARARARKKAAPAVIASLPDPPDRDELLRLLGRQAREGHVVAMRALLEEYRRDGAEDSPAAKSIVDELASRRGA